MSRMKRLLSICLAIAMLLSAMIIPVSASETSEMEFALQRVKSALSKENYLAEGAVYLSNALPFYDFDLGNTQIGNIYFVFDGEENIGTLIVYPVGNQYGSTFYMSDYAVVASGWQEEAGVILGRKNGVFLLCRDSNIHVLNNPYNRELDEIEVVQALESVTETVISGSNTVQLDMISRSIYYRLNVSHVSNVDIFGGICWAACLAAKINCQTGSNNLDALDVFYTCWDSVDRDLDSIPVGNDSWYRVGASLYGIPLTISDGPASATTIAAQLSAGKPIIMGISNGTVPGDWGDSGHAILLYGIDENPTFYEFTIMDSSDPNTVYLSFPHSVFASAYNFNYVTTFGTFTCWHTSRY